MLFKVEIVKLIDVFYIFHVSSVTSPPRRCRAVPRADNTLDFSLLKVSTNVVL